MLLLSHAAAGALISQVVPNPVLAFALSFVSHFVMDAIPHGDTHQYERYQRRERVRRAIAYVTMDAIAAMIFAVALFRYAPLLYPDATAAAIAGSVLPDFLVGLYDFGRVRALKRFHDFHFKIHYLIIHRFRDVSLPVGVGIQILVFALLKNKIF